jgi:ubiquinone/menaquinone biosynthesis C-methylase UbiE
MWTWIITGLVIILLAVLITGFRRRNIVRRVGPDEGIEDIEVASGYDKISQWPQFRLIRKLIIGELRRCEPKGTLVDIGCGPGYLTVDILKAFPHLTVTGMDIAGEMVQKASGNVSRLGFGARAGFYQGDIHGLPFESGSVDFVVSTLSMHHWTDPSLAVSEIYRVLKPGSGFLLFDLRRDSPRLFYWIIKFAQWFILPASMGRIDEPTSSALASYTPSELGKILSGTPFAAWNIKKGVFWAVVSGRKD